jgi:hypothetical protein
MISLKENWSKQLNNALFMLLISVLLYISHDWLTISILVFILSLAILVTEGIRLYHIYKKPKIYDFKSDKERFIAGFFDRNKIKYEYERKVKIKGQELKPDFYLPEYDVYLEYWGNLNDSHYYEIYKQKKALYKYDETPLIELFEDNLTDVRTLDRKFHERLRKIMKNR